jgi:hypothetical protein
MSGNQVLGKILWWSDRDENGVICDPSGNEYYFDRSVVNLKKRQKLDFDTLVIFTPSRCDKILAAKEVTIPMSKLKPKYERRYEQEKNQLSLPIGF